MGGSAEVLEKLGELRDAVTTSNDVAHMVKDHAARLGRIESWIAKQEQEDVIAAAEARGEAKALAKAAATTGLVTDAAKAAADAEAAAEVRALKRTLRRLWKWAIPPILAALGGGGIYAAQGGGDGTSAKTSNAKPATAVSDHPATGGLLGRMPGMPLPAVRDRQRHKSEAGAGRAPATGAP